MKLISYHSPTGIRTGILHQEKAYDLSQTGRELGINLPESMLQLLEQADWKTPVAQVHKALVEGSSKAEWISNLKLAAPIPNPPSCRDAYAFRQHVETARRNRGAEMIPEFDQFPVFYFTNHRAIFGPGDIPVEQDHLNQLDFELELAIVIGKGGKNISAQHADEHIAGFTIMNDLSARQLQMEEMKLNLGPAKGKDFATAIGPWLVTPDEFDAKSTSNGLKYTMRMKAFHNGQQISDGNAIDMHWTFAEIIERASYGVTLYPGDVIGSGTVGSGCYLELNGTGQLENPEYKPVWLQEGDSIALEIAGLGRLSNRIVKTSGDYSILAQKKPI